jgi:hypothetical protein
VKATKAELLVLAFDNLPPKRYVVDEAAKKYDVDILPLVERFERSFCINKRISIDCQLSIVCSIQLN